VVAAIASADKPAVVEVGDLLPIVNGGFSPKALPKKGRPAPITFGLSAQVATGGGSTQPVLHEVTLELDRHITVDAKGMPICPLGNVESPPPERRCRPALVGKGTIEVLVGFPEQPPFSVKDKLLAFNGGVKHGVKSIFLYAYLSSPVSAAMVTTVGVTKVDRGRYGTKWLFVFPKIAGGYGSITSLNLEVSKRFPYLGEEKSFLVAGCPDGHLDGRATSVFADGTVEADSFARSCVPKG
jgi:hypothetical protein